MNQKYAQRLFKRTQAAFEKIAQHFSQTRNRPRPVMKYFVCRYVKPGQQILDLACGNGIFFELLKDKKIHYLGIDSSKTLILEAKRKYPQAKFVVGDVLKLKLNRKFDLVFSFAFLHHLPGMAMRNKFLKKIQKILKPKGYFICTCWNSFSGKKMKYLEKFNALYEAGKSKLDFNDALVPWKDSKGKVLAKIYYHRFRQQELKELFETAGFKIIELFYEKDGKKSSEQKGDNLCLVASLEG